MSEPRRGGLSINCGEVPELKRAATKDNRKILNLVEYLAACGQHDAAFPSTRRENPTLGSTTPPDSIRSHNIIFQTIVRKQRFEQRVIGNLQTANIRLTLALLASSIVSATTLFFLGITTGPVLAVSIFLAIAMAAIAAIDFEHYVIPDVLSLPVLVVGLVLSGPLQGQHFPHVVALDQLAGAVAGGASLLAIRQGYFVWRGHEGLGLGDVKLSAAAGAWVGLSALPVFFLVAATSALVVVAVGAAWSRTPVSGQLRIPFGTFLAPSLWIVWMGTITGAIPI